MELLKLNLQHFAEEDTTTNEEEVETTENDNDDQEQENATYSRSDVDREVSKAVEKAISNQRAKWEEEKQAEIEKERQDAVEYAKMSQKEKDEAEYKKRIDLLEKREKELNDKQLLSEIESDLKENKLPTSFAQSLLTLQDNEKIKQSITNIKKDFDEAVNAQVKEALREETPEANSEDLSDDPFKAKLAKYK